MRVFLLFVIIVPLSIAFSPVLSAATLGTPTDEAFTATYDGSTQYYMQLLPTDFNPANQYDVIIALHGSGSTRTQYAYDSRDECRATRDVAANHDMIMICPDYRAATSWMNAPAESDVLQIINDLKSQYNVGKVIVTGASMGGAGCLTFTALHPDVVDGVCSVNGLANFVGYTTSMPALIDQIAVAFGGYYTQNPSEYVYRSAINYPQSFTMPMSITAGMLDTVVPPQSVIQLFNTVKNTNPVNPNVVSFIRTAGGHSTNYVDTAVALEYVVQNAQGIDTDLHPISVNTSFEYQNLSVGGSTTTVDGWTKAIGTGASVVNLTPAGIAAKFNGPIPDGSQIASVRSDAVYQFTGTTVQPGTYHMSFETASGKDNAQVGTFRAGFMVDDSTVAGTMDLDWGAPDSYVDDFALTPGNWTTVNVDWVVPSDSTAIGKYLYINYWGVTDNTVYLDDVHVSFTPVPEPSTLAMLTAGLIALAACAWKRRKRL
ncbi:MAG: alpha/beta fold hydrolase [Pirellulales bacterium]|nr:alpha/beta fold hydrolase [Pirellulales bacterium]